MCGMCTLRVCTMYCVCGTVCMLCVQYSLIPRLCAVHVGCLTLTLGTSLPKCVWCVYVWYVHIACVHDVLCVWHCVQYSLIPRLCAVHVGCLTLTLGTSLPKCVWCVYVWYVHIACVHCVHVVQYSLIPRLCAVHVGCRRLTEVALQHVQR